MHLTTFTTMSDRAEIEALVRSVAVAQLVTAGADGMPEATLLPILWEGDRVIAHAGAGNPQFQKLAPDTPALAVVTGPDAYVSPSWAPSRLKHGFIAPTWNYLVVHLYGTLTVHTDPEWMRTAVTDLTRRHEAGRDPEWSVAEAPRNYVDGLLQGMVGLELTVTDVRAKAKLSQNRVEGDRLGIIEGLRGESDPSAHAVADEMALREDRPWPPR